MRKALFLFFVPLCVFLTNLDGTWVNDDHFQVAENPYIRSLANIPKIVQSRVWQVTGAETRGTDIYRPVFLLSYLLDFQLYGARSWGFHLTNNLLHALNVFLFFLLARGFVAETTAFTLALLFAVHPIVVEGVTWIGSRHDLLMTLFALLNMLLFRQITEADKRPERWSWVAYAATIPLGFFSKENFVLIPYAIPLATFSALHTREQKKRAFHLMGMTALIMLPCLLWRQAVVGAHDTSFAPQDLFFSASALLSRFLKVLFVPADSDPAFTYVPRGFSWASAIAPIVILSLALGVGFFKQKHAIVRLGTLLFLAALLPCSPALAKGGAVGERYFYLPFAGFLLMLGPGIDRLRAIGQPLIRLLGAVLILSLATLSTVRNRDWKDDVTLYETSILRDPNNFTPYYYLAWYYRRTGNVDAEMEMEGKLLAVDPGHVATLNNLAVKMIERRRWENAKSLLKRAYEASPGRAQTSYNIGFLFEKEGQRKKALNWYRRALSLKPDHALASKAVARLTSTAP